MSYVQYAILLLLVAISSRIMGDVVAKLYIDMKKLNK